MDNRFNFKDIILIVLILGLGIMLCPQRRGGHDRRKPAGNGR